MDERKVSSATEACIRTATKKQRLSLLGLHHMLDAKDSMFWRNISPTAVRKSYSLETVEMTDETSEMTDQL